MSERLSIIKMHETIEKSAQVLGISVNELSLRLMNLLEFLVENPKVTGYIFEYAVKHGFSFNMPPCFACINNPKAIFVFSVNNTNIDVTDDVQKLTTIYKKPISCSLCTLITERLSESKESIVKALNA